MVGCVSYHQRLFFSFNEVKTMDEFYTIEETLHEEEMTQVNVLVNPEHVIYKAHFPEYPITPGAILVGMAADLASSELGIDRDLTEVKNVKFLVPHLPQEHPHLSFRMKLGESSADVVIADGEITFSKMTLIF